jgi:AcrR family transcriptional regulator
MEPTMARRGVAIAAIRERLRDAAERRLVRDCPERLTSRAITSEAVCAKGILHRHFPDLDGFLTEFVLDRLGSATSEVARLPASAGEGTVVGNLCSAARSLFGSSMLATANLVTARPSIFAPIRELELRTGQLALSDIEGSFAAYLRAEKRLGRISPDADVETLALALIGALHHLFVSGRAGPNLAQRVDQIVLALFRGVVTQPIASTTDGP